MGGRIREGGEVARAIFTPDMREGFDTEPFFFFLILSGYVKIF